ncbi:immediate early response gene 2 protein, partial [Polyodon spathula]
MPMEVNAEAKRIMALSVSKLYSCRMQRGGMKLHRSLQLSLVMRSARDIYFIAKLGSEAEAAGRQPGAEDRDVAVVTEAVGQAATEPQQSAETGCETGTEAHMQTEPSPEPSCAPAVTQPLTEAPSNVPAKTECKPKPAQIVPPGDKENASPRSCSAVPALAPDRHSRKRRGKAPEEPEFLPSKKSRIEQAEAGQGELSALAESSARASNTPWKGGEPGLKSSSCRGGGSLASSLGGSLFR